MRVRAGIKFDLSNERNLAKINKYYFTNFALAFALILVVILSFCAI